ncbi:hypothetical protein AB1Y20_009744 [Prymnesium parvum]|uniref:Uncharacterized protein n=1 Tax=Prymnesium parvum TaxID=97485 RepID=A0AB34K2Y9_PRYPA
MKSYGYPPASSSIPIASVVGSPVQQPAIMMVTCPPGVYAGQPLTITNPANGQPMQFLVPHGVQPGQTFQVQFPDETSAPAPVVVQGMPVGGDPMVVQGSLASAPNVVQGMPPSNPNARRCRGCGDMFVPPPGVNRATAASFRCSNCQGGGVRFF